MRPEMCTGGAVVIRRFAMSRPATVISIEAVSDSFGSEADTNARIQLIVAGRQAVDDERAIRPHRSGCAIAEGRADRKRLNVAFERLAFRVEDRAADLRRVHWHDPKIEPGPRLTHGQRHRLAFERV